MSKSNYSDDFFEECADRLKTEEGLSVRKLAKELGVPVNIINEVTS